MTQTFRFTVPHSARLGRVWLSVVVNGIAAAEVEVGIELTNQYWLWEAFYREEALLIGHLADGGYVIIRPGGVHPVGPWDPTILKRLDAAVEETRAMAVASSAGRKRVMELPRGVTVSVGLDFGEPHAGLVLRTSETALTIESDGQVHDIKREEIADVRTLTIGFAGKHLKLPDGAPFEADVLVYRTFAQSDDGTR